MIGNIGFGLLSDRQIPLLALVSNDFRSFVSLVTSLGSGEGTRKVFSSGSCGNRFHIVSMLFLGGQFTSHVYFYGEVGRCPAKILQFRESKTHEHSYLQNEDFF